MSKFHIIDMHTGGMPVRIIEEGYPEIKGETILEKYVYIEENLDHLRKLLMREPRGHKEMYGAILVKPDHPEADLAAIFAHNSGYGTMCGHASIAIIRHAVETGKVAKGDGEHTDVLLQCPCGLIRARYEHENKFSTFQNVPVFAPSLDVKLNVPGYGEIKVDIGYGGAFYVLLSADKLGLELRKTEIDELRSIGKTITEAAKSQLTVKHPKDPELEFITGTIITDGITKESTPTYQIVVFGDGQVDRSPCGSGTSARVAVEYAKHQVAIGTQRTFIASATGSAFFCKPLHEEEVGSMKGLVVEVTGKANYCGTTDFVLEEDDPFQEGL